MGAIVCELCGNNSFVKQDGYFVCQNCGMKYSVEEARKMMSPAQIEGHSNINENKQTPLYTSQPQTSLGEERKASLQEMERMIEYFQPKQNLYDEYDEISKTVKFGEARKGGNTTTGIVFSIIIMIGAFALGYVVESMVIFLFCEIVGVALLVGTIVFSKRDNKVLDETELKPKYIRLNVIINELEEHYKRYGYCVVGIEYTNPKILKAIYSLIREGRADNPKEAINLMLTDAHRSEMELRALQTASSARSAAVGSNAAAWFCAASFFLK